MLPVFSERVELLSIDIGAMFPTIGEGDDKRFTVYHKTVLDWLMDRTKSQRSADNQINLFWLQKSLPDATISDLKDILSVFEKEKIIEFDHFNDITADDWNKQFGAIPRRYRSRIMAYLDEGHDFSNEMLFNYYIDPVEGHRTFSQGLLDLIDGYEPLSVVSSMVFPSKEDDYFYNHLGCKERLAVHINEIHISECQCETI